MKATWRDMPTTVPDAVAALREMGYKARSEELLVVDGDVPGRKLIATLQEDGRTWEYAGAWGTGKTSFWGLVTVVKGLDAPAPSTSWPPGLRGFVAGLLVVPGAVGAVYAAVWLGRCIWGV